MAEGGDWCRKWSRAEKNIRRETRKQHLMPVKGLMDELNLIRNLDKTIMVELVRGQYDLAKRRGLRRWMGDLHHYGTYLMPRRDLQELFPRLEHDSDAQRRPGALQKGESRAGGARSGDMQRRPDGRDVKAKDANASKRPAERAAETKEVHTSGRPAERAVEVGRKDAGDNSQRRLCGRAAGAKDASFSRRSSEETLEIGNQDASKRPEGNAAEAVGKYDSKRPTVRAVGIGRGTTVARTCTSKSYIVGIGTGPQGPQSAFAGVARVRDAFSQTSPPTIVSTATQTSFGPKMRAVGCQTAESVGNRGAEWQGRRVPFIVEGRGNRDKQNRVPQTGKRQREEHSVSEKSNQVVEQGPSATKKSRGNGPRGKKRAVKHVCPWKGCPMTVYRLKRHIEARHMPKLFWDKEPADLVRTRRFQEKRLGGLEILAQDLTGSSAVTRLTSYVERVRPQHKFEILLSSRTAMYYMCRVAGWRVPPAFNLYPVSSPAVLIYWEYLLHLLCLVSDEARETFHRYCEDAIDELTGRAERPSRDTRAEKPKEQDRMDPDRDAEERTNASNPEPQRMSSRDDSRCQVNVSVEDLPFRSVEPEPGPEPMDISVKREPDGNQDPGDRRPTVTVEGQPVELSSMSQVALMSGMMGLCLTRSPGNPAPTAVAEDQGSQGPQEESVETPNSKASPVTEQEEELLLRSDTDSPISYSRVLQAKPAVGVVKPVLSPKRASGLLKDSSWPMAFDSHFHPDRLASSIGAGIAPIERLVGQVTEVEPVHRTVLSGGVAVYCDPRTYDQVALEAHPKWRLAVGVHPKKIRDFSWSKKAKLVSLVKNPRVCALGEVGLDYSDPDTDKEAQQTVLAEMLRHCTPQKTLVLHVRGDDRDRLSAEAAKDCLAIVRAACLPEQKIHLHCFTGGVQQLREWRAAFPDCHFGVTGKAAHFSKEKREALRLIPRDRLLLETDSPYMPMLAGLRTTTPAYIGDVASAVATIREESVEAVLLATEANGRRLYPQ